MNVHYSGLIASVIEKSLADAAVVDQRQQNALYGVHQMRVSIKDPQPNEQPTYRVIIAPADAPVWIGRTPVSADEHFLETIHSVQKQPEQVAA